MRTKPLNPNSMQMIMENFRRYETILENQYGKSDNLIYLFEHKKDFPTTIITVDELFEEHRQGKISEEALIHRWKKSWDYEMQEVDRLYEGWEDEARRQHKEAGECDPAFNPAACSEEELAAANPEWMDVLGQLFQKMMGAIRSAVTASWATVVKIANSTYKSIVKFKEKHPVVFWTITIVLLGALLAGIVYATLKFFEALQESDANIEMPLCAQAIAGTLKEATGQCIAMGGVLDALRYKEAMGLLRQIDRESPAGSPRSKALAEAMDALTKCWEGAQGGKVINVDDLLVGSETALGALNTTGAILDNTLADATSIEVYPGMSSPGQEMTPHQVSGKPFQAGGSTPGRSGLHRDYSIQDPDLPGWIGPGPGQGHQLRRSAVNDKAEEARGWLKELADDGHKAMKEIETIRRRLQLPRSTANVGDLDVINHVASQFNAQVLKGGNAEIIKQSLIKKFGPDTAAQILAKAEELMP